MSVPGQATADGCRAILAAVKDRSKTNDLVIAAIYRLVLSLPTQTESKVLRKLPTKLKMALSDAVMGQFSRSNTSRLARYMNKTAEQLPDSRTAQGNDVPADASRAVADRLPADRNRLTKSKT